MQTNADVISRCTRHSREAMSAAQQLPRTFIRWLQWPHPVFDRYATSAHKTAGWRYHELAASHDPFVTDPAPRGSRMKR